MTEELKEQLIAFYESIPNYYGWRLTIKWALSNNTDNFNRHFTSFGKMEFTLTNFRVRISGARITFEGDSQYFEIGDGIYSLNETAAHQFEINERVSKDVHQKVLLEFKNKP